MTDSAYYNEHDPYAAQWLRNLIAAGHIAPGDVDERSIEDVHPDDLKPYTQCHFFAGIGVWSLALRRAGWPDSRPVWTGSCPCQPYSAAGQGLGFDDPRHLWPAFVWLIRQRRPPVVLGEQVASKAVEPWVDLVHADLEAMAYAFGAEQKERSGMNIYRHTFIADCPADGERIIYRLEIRSPVMIRVEHIRTATALIKRGYQESIADSLHQQFGGEQRIVAVHQAIEVETLRGIG